MKLNKYTYHFIRLAAKYSSPVLWLLEKINRSHKKDIDQNPIFIIGPPRTGSTLLYQLITNNDEVLYINNFINLFYRNLYSGFIFYHCLFKNHRPHKSFSSELGNTLNSGWRAPSESGNFWYNWLDKKNSYEINNNLNERKVSKIRDLLTKIMSRYNKPLVFKNLNNSQRLPLIHQINPHSKIIWLKRDPRYTAQSIIQARRKLKIRNNEVWSINPKGLQPKMCKNEYELVAKQIHLIEKQIENDIQLFPSENILVVDYTSIQKDLKKILQFCGVKSEPTKIMLDQIRTVNNRSLSAEEWTKLEREINKLDWI